MPIPSPPPRPRFEAVFFDFGGTLFSYLPFRQRFLALLEETARDHGVEREAGELVRAYAEVSRRVGADYLGRPSYLHRDFFGDCGEAFVRAFGARPRDDLRERFYRGQTEVARPLIRPRDDATETLRGLRERSLHVAVVSNIDDDQFETLWQLCGLDGLVDARTTSEEARSCKPDSRIFRHALEKTGGAAPERTLFVGDSLDHDVVGARALGMTTVLIAERPPDPDAAIVPDHRVESLIEILALVDAND